MLAVEAAAVAEE